MKTGLAARMVLGACGIAALVVGCRNTGECNKNDDCPNGQLCLVDHRCSQSGGGPSPSAEALGDNGGAAPPPAATASVQGAPAAFVTVLKDGPGQGSVVSDPPQLDCGAVCSVPVPPGAHMHLVAKPAPGYAFAKWGGGTCDASHISTCDVIVDGPMQVVATFVPAGAPAPQAVVIVTPPPPPTIVQVVPVVPVAPPTMCKSQCADVARACKSRCKADFSRGDERKSCVLSCEAVERDCRAHSSC